LKNKAPNVRFFWIHEGFTELNDWPTGLQGPGFLWVTTGRREFELHQAAIQHHLHALAVPCASSRKRCSVPVPGAKRRNTIRSYHEV